MIEGNKDTDMERNMTTRSKDRARPDEKPTPAPDPTPEELAQAMLSLPPDHEWEYLKKGKAKK